MKRVRFTAEGIVHEGIVREGALYDAEGRRYDPDRVIWLPPVSPTKVLGVALNYPEHATELGMRTPEEPPLFFKPISCLVGHRAPVVYPRGVEYLHYEVELAVVIGRRCRKVRPEEAMQVVQGYTIANDITVRDFVGDFYRPPVRAKGYDTFGPVGPWVVEGEIEDPHDLEMRVYVNGELRQRGNTREMLWKIPQLITWVSSFMTLEPGDLILTGTPRGISPVRPGDVMRLEIEGIGTLENPVVAEENGTDA
ncbi:MAG: fumarylacetoacetate hydrolase family protein [Armatimonadota bacterium]|nr:fumarylacetoacetate hydrolase family protein [Armatimonadota bacterium]MDR7439936.1 fumarylacetoacetate hydrolase family protein [Armatimonadota bacterium]MDR7562716.1 fumarylacetoacetate hydrolase family protein [Armatimonadota bacterium]MDR7567865.1 fumarylacetoacetate hydrolase family protein [Armatimonadota bacterium]MDR7601015.1 fumarylacetoacetate hydrolase family protein [Armatimonadota bacterium]